jgi:hypothetical protein
MSVLKFVTMIIMYAYYGTEHDDCNATGMKQFKSIIPCAINMRLCQQDDSCNKCFNNFDSKITNGSFASCEMLDHDIRASWSCDLDYQNKNATELLECVEDEVFFLLTFETVKHMCSPKIMEM